MYTYKQLTYIVIFTLLFFGAVSVQAQTEVRTNIAPQTDVRAGIDIDDKCGPDEVCPEDISELESERCDDGVCPEQGAQERCEDGVCTEIDKKDIRAVERCDDGICTEIEEAAGANYNNTRSNKAGLQGPDTSDSADTEINICDGVTCSDGSCAATASECSGLDEEARGLDQKFQQVATSVSPVRDADSDGDGLDDGGQSDAAETDVTGEIILGEDRDMVMPGDNKSNLDDNDNTDRANYNNSRSNRSTIVGGGSDGPLDRTRKGAIKELDKASPKLMTALSIDDDSPIKGEGVELYVRSDICGIGDEDCDDNGVPANVSPRDLTLHVSGERVRGWNPDQKAELSRRLQAAGTSTTTNDFGLRIAQAAIENDNIADIASDDQTTEVSFRTRMRLLGFIPTQANATARADADGEVEVDYPWYGFLASKGDSSIFSSLASELRAAHDVMVSPVNDPPQASDE